MLNQNLQQHFLIISFISFITSQFHNHSTKTMNITEQEKAQFAQLELNDLGKQLRNPHNTPAETISIARKLAKVFDNIETKSYDNYILPILKKKLSHYRNQLDELLRQIDDARTELNSKLEVIDVTTALSDTEPSSDTEESRLQSTYKDIQTIQQVYIEKLQFILPKKQNQRASTYVNSSEDESLIQSSSQQHTKRKHDDICMPVGGNAGNSDIGLAMVQNFNAYF